MTDEFTTHPGMCVMSSRAVDLALELGRARMLIEQLEARIAELEGRREMCKCGHTIASHAPGECVGCHEAGDPFPAPVDTQQPVIIYHDQAQVDEPLGFRLAPTGPPKHPDW